MYILEARGQYDKVNGGQISGELTDIIPELAQYLVLKEKSNGNFKIRWHAKVKSTRSRRRITTHIGRINLIGTSI